MKRPKSVGMILLASVAELIGIGGILPALAQVRNVGAMPGALVGSYTLGVFLLSVAGASIGSYAIRRRQRAGRA